MCVRFSYSHTHTTIASSSNSLVCVCFFFCMDVRALPSFVKQQSSGLMLLLLLVLLLPSRGIIWKHCNVPNPCIIHCCSFYTQNETEEYNAAFWALLLTTTTPTPTTLNIQTNKRTNMDPQLSAYMLGLNSNKMTNHERYKRISSLITSLHSRVQMCFVCIYLVFIISSRIFHSSFACIGVILKLICIKLIVSLLAFLECN